MDTSVSCSADSVTSFRAERANGTDMLLTEQGKFKTSHKTCCDYRLGKAILKVSSGLF
jgi:hypothetical protein